MEELFRFNVTRAVERIEAPTLDLRQNTPFQEELSAIARQPRVSWLQMRVAAVSFVKTNATIWINDLIKQQIPQVLIFKQLLADLLTVEQIQWQALVKDNIRYIGAEQLNNLRERLSDLFLALLIIRSAGPTGISQFIRTEQPLSSDLVELLNDRPSLDEIADLLKIIDLVSIALVDVNKINVETIHSTLRKTLLLPLGLFSAFKKPIHAVGITDLLVVKQHIARYEAGEIARIENVLKGESRKHSQKHTLSNEQDRSFEIQTTTETDQELSSSDHVNIRNEAEATVKEETKLDNGLHVQYDGGSFKMQDDFTVAYDKSSSESKKFSTEIAKDVTQKAVKKVSQRITQSQTTKIIEAFEENEEQSFNNNIGKTHVIGVYQWIEKVYLAQVFNYGRHILFDVMIPDPAASWWKQIKILQEKIKQPEGPDPLIISPLDISVDPANANFYGNLVAKYQVTGVEPPPPPSITLSASKVIPYEDNKEKRHEEVLRVDDGYAAYFARATATWITNDDDDSGIGEPPGDSFINLVVGGIRMLFTYDPTRQWRETGDSKFVNETMQVALNPYNPNEPVEERTITYGFNTNFVNAMTLNLEITCVRTAELLAKWQLQAYEKIATRWQKLQEDYEAKLAAAEQEKRQITILEEVRDTETNRQIERTELKRNCIALLDNSYNFAHGFNATKDWVNGVDPDISKVEHGIWVRWFEQAFEWDKIGYIFYPYYWGESKNWADRLNQKNDDVLFLRFLQAGYARVVIPVRNGFEAAVNFYMQTGIPWLGGSLPSIGDKDQNPLYLSIVEEIKEQSGAPGDEKPVGDPWEIHLPTTLIKLRKELDGTTPVWKRTTGPSSAPDSSWTWTEDKSS